MHTRVPIIVPLFLFALSGSVAGAVEVLDQVNEPAWSGAWTNMFPGNSGQSFTPTLAQLTAIEISILTGNAGRGGDQITLSLWDGSLMLSEETVDVQEGFDGWLRFEFPTPVEVQPGTQYVFRVEDTGQVVFGWRYAGNTYAQGDRLFLSDPDPSSDFFFRTYAEAGDGCVRNDETLCLNNGRFKVTVDWSGPGFPTRPAFVSELGTPDSGLFYFLDPDNLEFLIKVLNGCGITNHFWVFFAATTDVGFTVTVTDTQTDVVKEYHNPQGQPADAVTDTSAFATCP